MTPILAADCRALGVLAVIVAGCACRRRAG